MNLKNIWIHVARTWIRGWVGRGDGGTEGSGLPKGMVPCTETRTARRGPGLGPGQRFDLGHVNIEESAELSKR